MDHITGFFLKSPNFFRRTLAKIFKNNDQNIGVNILKSVFFFDFSSQAVPVPPVRAQVRPTGARQSPRKDLRPGIDFSKL
jgi:hypothetical protein